MSTQSELRGQRYNLDLHAAERLFVPRSSHHTAPFSQTNDVLQLAVLWVLFFLLLVFVALSWYDCCWVGLRCCLVVNVVLGIVFCCCDVLVIRVFRHACCRCGSLFVFFVIFYDS